MVSVCLPPDALSQNLPSYLGFSYLGRGVSLHSCSRKAQPLLLTLEKGCLLKAAPPDLERGVAPLRPPAPLQPLLLGGGVAPLHRCPRPQTCDSSSRPPPLTSNVGPHGMWDLRQDLSELTPNKDVLFIIGDWNAKVGSQETPGVTGKFHLGVRNEQGKD